MKVISGYRLPFFTGSGFFLTSVMFFTASFTQDLEDFYENKWAVYPHITIFSSTAEAYQQTVPNPSFVNRSVIWSLNFDQISGFNTRPAGFTWEFKTKVLGDLWHWLYYEMKKLGTNTGSTKYSPYVTSIYEFNFGLNLIGSDALVFAAGLAHNCYIISMYDYRDPPLSTYNYMDDSYPYIKNGVHFTGGFFGRADLVFTEGLAVRLGGTLGKSLTVANASNMVKEPSKQLPLHITFTPEIFTRAGFFIGMDIWMLKRLVSNKPGIPYFSASRTDLKMGWRLKL